MLNRLARLALAALLALAPVASGLVPASFAAPSQPPQVYAEKEKMVGNRCGAGYVSDSTSGLPNQATQTRHAIWGLPSKIRPVFAGFDLGGDPTEGTDERTVSASNYRVSSFSVASGGTSFVRGQVALGPTTNASSQFRGEILGTSSGVVTDVGVADPGAYDSIPTNPVAQSGSTITPNRSTGSTNAAASGLTVNATWRAEGPLIRAQLVPDWNNQATTGANAPKRFTWKRGDNSDSPDWFIPPGGLLYLPPIAVQPTSNPHFVGLRLWTHGSSVPRWRNTIASVDYFATGTSGDVTANNNALAGNAQGIFQPPAFWLGTPTLPTSAGIILGDSISYAEAAGADPDGDGFGNHGWFERGMWIANIGGYCKAARSGQRLQRYFTGGGRQNRLQLIREAKPDWVLIAYWANDLVSTTTGGPWTTLAANEAQLVQEIKALGVKKVFTVTGTPMTTTSDGYTTVAGQTIWVDTPGTAQRGVENMSRNAALRGGTHPAAYDGYFDLAALMESSVGSGKWKVRNPDGSGVGTRVTISVSNDVHMDRDANIEAAQAFAVWIAANAPRS